MLDLIFQHWRLWLAALGCWVLVKLMNAYIRYRKRVNRL